MGILGSSLGRALAGAGSGIADVANKYLDEQLLTRRAQVLADIQRTSAVQQAKDIDTAMNDPGRRERLRVEGAKDVTSAAAAALPGEVERTRQVGKATADTATQAEIDRGTNPLYIKAKRAEALATHIESAGSLAQAQLAKFQLGVAQRLDYLKGQLQSAVRTGDKMEEDRLQREVDVLQDKGGAMAKFYSVAEHAAAAMAPALKILNDQYADEGAKREAAATVRQQRAIVTSAGKRIGIDLEEAGKVPEDQDRAEAMAALKKGASLADINARRRAAGFPDIADPNAKPQNKSIFGSSATGSPAVPPYTPPPDSPAGKRRALMDSAAAQRATEEGAQRQRAADAYAALPPGDKVAARRLQASALFGYLAPEQQRTIYALVNAR